jgi:hypothetical protein
VRVYVEGIGLRGPGLDGWAASRAVLAGAEPYIPAPASIPASPLLPANERRRMVQTVKLALAVGAEAFEAARRDAAATATVFTSSGGDGETIHEILKALAADDPELSPTRFHNSVHNAPAGYWSIAIKSHAPSSSLCCHDASFAAGLLEAAVQATVDDRAVALIAYDLPYPEPLNSVRRIGAVFGAALLLTPGANENSLAQMDIEITHGPGKATPMADPALEALRQDTPAARSLPLLAAIARNTPLTLSLDYVSGLRIELSLERAATLAGVDRRRGECRAARS